MTDMAPVLRIEPLWVIRADGTRDHATVLLDGRFRVREARLADLRAAERFHAKLVAYCAAKWAPVREAHQGIMDAGGVAHAFPTHKHDSPGRWWEWRCSPDGFFFEWVAQPDPPLHHDLGQHLYDRWRFYYMTAAARAHKARLLLVEATRRAIMARDARSIDLLRIQISGHSYLWRVGDHGWPVPLRLWGDLAGVAFEEWAL